jgi:hypothetical protein
MDEILSRSASYPRLSAAAATRRLVELSGKTPDALTQDVSVDVSRASYYPLSFSRVSSASLSELRRQIVSLAVQFGFPETRTRGDSLKFDQSLSSLLAESMPMMPAEAADEGVWSFFTLNVCPDVAFWRFPNVQADGGAFRTDYERLIGRPRNVFRRAWWRGHVLGPDLSSQLLEDESVGIMERPSIGGNAVVARSVASRQLEYAGRPGFGKRQDLLRDAAKRLRRRMALISMYSLQKHQIEAIVKEVFEEAYVAVLGPLGADGHDPTVVQLDKVERFRALIPDHFDALEKDLVPSSASEIISLKTRLSDYLEDFPANREAAAKISKDLSVLLDEWELLDAEEQKVVRAASAYVLTVDDEVPDYYLGGLGDDDEVVTAAFEALGRIRPVS